MGGELLRNPLVTLDGAGGVVSVEICSEPDRMAFTQFWPGVLVVDFPADYRSVFARMQTSPDAPLPELLMRFVPGSSASGCLVVISGLDYNTFCLSLESQIRKF